MTHLNYTKQKLPSIQTSIKLILKVTLWIAFVFGLSFGTELMQKGNLVETWKWATTFTNSFLLGTSVVGMIFLLFYAITCRTWISMIGTSLITLGAGLTNYFKVAERGDPFVPWDVLLVKETSNILEYINLNLDKWVWIVLIIVVVAIIGAFFLKENKLKWYWRIATTAGVSAILVGVLVGVCINPKMLERIHIQDVNWNQTSNYERNGFLTGFLINLKNVFIAAPTGYSENTVNEILEGDEKTATTEVAQKPNIIMIMNEAFWDPTKLPGVEFSEDPLPTINKLRSEGTTGWMVTPTYGGGTANTEFEVLTGHAMMFMPSGSIAYQQYVKGPTGSLVGYLKDEGYNAVAVHPYQKWFWNREDVYPYLGFDEFISDEDFKNPEIRGNFISDMTAVKRMIKEYHDHNDKPFFGFMVTMENHSTYEEKHYGTRNITAVAPGASEETNAIINNYTQGVKDADAALGHLINYFEGVNEPTIIVMFGDHLPMLGRDYQVYKELGYVNEAGDFSPQNYLDLYTTPVVVWSNYNDQKEDLGTFNAHYLAPYVLEKAGLPMPAYFEVLQEMKQEVPVCNAYMYQDKEGNLHPTPTKEAYGVLSNHWQLQYDMLFGKGYGEDKMYEPSN